MKQCTPRKLDRFVTVLCAKIKPGAAPIYVPIQPLLGALPDECFLNVRNKIAKDAGSLIHGWRIWELPGLLIEGEFHGVWLSPAGEHIDVTPLLTSDRQILFLPDTEKSFDEQAFNRRDNIRATNRPPCHSRFHCPLRRPFPV